MKRRELFKYASFLGLSGQVMPFMKKAYANAPANSGTLLVRLHLRGGLDFTHLCDPKGTSQWNKSFTEAEIIQPGQAGNISPFRLPPFSRDLGGGVTYGPMDFFKKYGDRFSGINGLNYMVSAHSLGIQACWCGLTNKKLPSLSALVSAIQGSQLDLPYLMANTYNYDAGIVLKTRLDASKVASLAYPQEGRLGDDAYQIILDAERSRCQNTESHSDLIFRRRQFLNYCEINKNSDLMQRLNTSLTSISEEANHLDNSIYLQGRIGLHAHKLGLTKAVDIDYGAFDTHGNNDDPQTVQICNVLYGVHLLFSEAERMGLSFNLLIGSDFGRTAYNADGGKDHRPIGSLLCAGPDFPAGKVWGGTDAQNNPITVSRKDLVTPDANGVIINVQHMHVALRKALGIAGHDLLKDYQIEAEDLPLFV